MSVGRSQPMSSDRDIRRHAVEPATLRLVGARRRQLASNSLAASGEIGVAPLGKPMPAESQKWFPIPHVISRAPVSLPVSSLLFAF
jgi:hypothetical protein